MQGKEITKENSEESKPSECKFKEYFKPVQELITFIFDKHHRVLALLIIVFFLLNGIGALTIRGQFFPNFEEVQEVDNSADEPLGRHQYRIEMDYRILSEEGYIVGMLHERIYFNDSEAGSTSSVLYKWDLQSAYYRYWNRKVYIIESLNVSYYEPLFFTSNESNLPEYDEMYTFRQPETETLYPRYTNYYSSINETVTVDVPESWNNSIFNIKILPHGPFAIENNEQRYIMYGIGPGINPFEMNYFLWADYYTSNTFVNKQWDFYLFYKKPLYPTQLEFWVTASIVVLVAITLSVIMASDIRRNRENPPKYIETVKEEIKTEIEKPKVEKYADHVQATNIVFIISLAINIFTVLTYYWASTLFDTPRLRKFMMLVFCLEYYQYPLIS